MCGHSNLYRDQGTVLRSYTVIHDDGENIGVITFVPGITWNDSPAEGGFLAAPPKEAEAFVPSQFPYQEYAHDGETLFIFKALYLAQSYLEEVYKKNQAAA